MLRLFIAFSPQFCFFYCVFRKLLLLGLLKIPTSISLLLEALSRTSWNFSRIFPQFLKIRVNIPLLFEILFIIGSFFQDYFKYFSTWDHEFRLELFRIFFSLVQILSNTTILHNVFIFIDILSGVFLIFFMSSSEDFEKQMFYQESLGISSGVSLVIYSKESSKHFTFFFDI